MTVRPNVTKSVCNPSSIFAKLERDDLRDDETLANWFKAATTRKRPVVTDCYKDWLNVFAAAERALELGTNPVALFAHIVGEHQWQLISNEQEDRARHRLRRLRNPEREAERLRRHDDDDSTGELSEPLFVGDMLAEFVAKLCHSPLRTESQSCTRRNNRPAPRADHRTCESKT